MRRIFVVLSCTEFKLSSVSAILAPMGLALYQSQVLNGSGWSRDRDRQTVDREFCEDDMNDYEEEIIEQQLEDFDDDEDYGDPMEL